MTLLAIIDPKTPPHVKHVIKKLEQSYFNEVRTMLRLPQPDLPAACNFAIAQVLAAVVSGISVTLYSQTGYKGERFKGLLENFYPWSLEPGNMVTPKDGAKVIYSLIRNPLTHDLGLDLDNKREGQKIIIKRILPKASENLIAKLESSGPRLEMSPTVTIEPGRTEVRVEAFYWGVCRMIEGLSRDMSRMQSAESFLSSKLKFR